MAQAVLLFKLSPTSLQCQNKKSKNLFLSVQIAERKIIIKKIDIRIMWKLYNPESIESIGIRRRLSHAIITNECTMCFLDTAIYGQRMEPSSLFIGKLP